MAPEAVTTIRAAQEATPSTSAQEASYDGWVSGRNHSGGSPGQGPRSGSTVHDTALAARPGFPVGLAIGTGVAGGKGRRAAKGGRTARAKMAGMMARTIGLATEVVNTARCW
jgi:hypothetical protein